MSAHNERDERDGRIPSNDEIMVLMMNGVSLGIPAAMPLAQWIVEDRDGRSPDDDAQEGAS